MLTSGGRWLTACTIDRSMANCDLLNAATLTRVFVQFARCRDHSSKQRLSAVYIVAGALHWAPPVI